MHFYKFFPAIFLTLLFSCSTPNENVQKATSKIPELIERSEAIHHGNEWLNVQNQYRSNVQTIIENPANVEARLALIDLYIKEARVTGEHGHYYPAALKLCDEVLEMGTDRDHTFLAKAAKAGVLLSLHRFDESLEIAWEAVQLNPYNAQIYGVLVDCFVELGSYDKAVEMADRMISIRPDMRSYARISYLREIHGDVEGAKEAMELAVKSGMPGLEETAWAMLTLAEISLRYGNLEKAERIYLEILDMRPGYPFAIAGLGAVELEHGDLAQAEKWTQSAIDAIPEVGFYVQLAEIQSQLGNDKHANEILEEVFVMLEDDVASGHIMNLEYADLYLNMLNNPEKALLYALEEYEKRPDNLDVNRIMAQIHVALGNYDRAQTHIETAGRTNSKHPELKLLAALDE